MLGRSVSETPGVTQVWYETRYVRTFFLLRRRLDKGWNGGPMCSYRRTRVDRVVWVKFLDDEDDEGLRKERYSKSDPDTPTSSFLWCCGGRLDTRKREKTILTNGFGILPVLYLPISRLNIICDRQSLLYHYYRCNGDATIEDFTYSE